MARRTKADAEQTREALIRSAIDVFFQRGVARATLEDVAKAAGVTRGALYFHFRDKAELVLIIDDRARLPLDEFLLRLGDVRLDAAPWVLIAALTDALAGALASLGADRAWHKVLTVLLLRLDFAAESGAALDRQKQADMAVRAACRRIFEAVAVQGGLAPPWTPATAALAVQGLAIGLVQTWLRAPEAMCLATDGVSAARALLARMGSMVTAS